MSGTINCCDGEKENTVAESDPEAANSFAKFTAGDI